MRANTWIITLGSIALSGVMSLSFAEDDGTRGKGERGDREKSRFWESLSEDQRGKLREALRGVWSDPAVISAREEVKQASDSYQSAVRDAVKRVDPEVAELVVKLQAASEGEMRDKIGSGMHSKFGPRRSGEYPMGPPGYLDKLSEEEKERFKSAQEKARESESVKQAKQELDALHEEDSKLRYRRLAAHRKLRKAMMDSMAEVDPGIESLQERVYGEEKRFSGPDRSGKQKQKEK